ncbi:hypothetical protein EON65_13065 [archaeon]|nr:MAG: hypothetical protein EON65_13065 [archaeon]
MVMDQKYTAVTRPSSTSSFLSGSGSYNSNFVTFAFCFLTIFQQDGEERTSLGVVASLDCSSSFSQTFLRTFKQDGEESTYGVD